MIVIQSLFSDGKTKIWMMTRLDFELQTFCFFFLFLRWRDGNESAVTPLAYYYIPPQLKIWMCDDWRRALLFFIFLIRFGSLPATAYSWSLFCLQLHHVPWSQRISSRRDLSGRDQHRRSTSIIVTSTSTTTTTSSSSTCHCLSTFTDSSSFSSTSTSTSTSTSSSIWTPKIQFVCTLPQNKLWSTGMWRMSRSFLWQHFHLHPRRMWITVSSWTWTR